MAKKYYVWITIALTLFLLWGWYAEVSAQTPVNVEPTALRSDLGGTISLYATGSLTFSQQSSVRLEGYGILDTNYVNPTTLQATVPTGLAEDDYRLLILDANGATVGASSLHINAAPKPTATPKPHQEPPPGRPILTVRNYVVDPVQVRPGQEFTVSVEVYNNGSRAGENTMAVFPGGTFIPLDEKGHLFWQVHINATFIATQRFRAPKEISNGVHQLNVELSANDWEGNHYDYPTTIPVEVIGSSTGVAYTGKPKMIVEAITCTPQIVMPGAPFTLTLQIANRGSRTATNVMAHADTEATVPVVGSGVVAVDKVAIGGTATIALPLQLKPGQEGGRQGLGVTLEYSDYSGGNYSDQQTVGLDVDASLANQPQLLIQHYHTTPEAISPGDSFTLTLNIENVGGGDAQRLSLALGGEEGEQLGSFVPIEGSNVSFISRLPAGASEEVQMQLMVVGNAETKAQNLPVYLAYDTGTGTRETDTQRVSLMVQRRPAFKVTFYRPLPEMIMVGQPFPLPIELLNTGTARFSIPTLEATGDAFEFTDESSTTYVGTLEPGGSWTLDATAIPTQAGTLDVVVNAHYVNDLNQTEIYSEVLTVEVTDIPEPALPDGTEPIPGAGKLPESPEETLLQKIGRALKGFLGLGS